MMSVDDMYDDVMFQRKQWSAHQCARGKNLEIDKVSEI